MLMSESIFSEIVLSIAENMVLVGMIFFWMKRESNKTLLNNPVAARIADIKFRHMEGIHLFCLVTFSFFESFHI